MILGRPIYAFYNYDLNCVKETILKDDDDDMPEIQIGPRHSLWQQLQEADAMLVDEAMMQNVQYFHVLDRLLRKIMQAPDKIWGGKMMIVTGDYKQLPPVVKTNDPQDIFERSFKSSEYYEKQKLLRIETSERSKADPRFAQWADDWVTL